MKYRLWYAQLDVYDTVRRYVAILSRWKADPLTRDRLFVSDFYLVNPSLLHKTQMSADVRRAFNSLRVLKPEDCFLDYPSPALLYNKMAGIQVQALHNLIGKGLLDIAAIDSGQCILSSAGATFADEIRDQLVLPGEEAVLNFLTIEFATIGHGKGGLRSVTGLRRTGT
jgi:hypothetical protein